MSDSELAVVALDSFPAPALIARAGPPTRKKFFEFFTVPIRNAKREPPITAQSNSSWPGLSAPAIRTSKTLSPSRLAHISKCCNAGPRRAHGQTAHGRDPD